MLFLAYDLFVKRVINKFLKICVIWKNWHMVYRS